ncbi:MAG: cysteine desulfurase [Candidatus Omnitrophica bacterium]|nr:cysteine desulfurase [Candidatus Omnitrophota bacterium]
MKHIYFDYAATSPTDPDVVKVMEPYFYEKYGNASSPHALGREAQNALEQAREVLAGFIGAKPEEIVFTSGATEANNQAIFGVARANANKGRHLVISAVEHHSVHEPADFLETQGFKVTYVPADENGVIHPQVVADAITNETILIAIMHASNEIGTIQPVVKIAEIAKGKNIPFLVDAVQTVGHIPVNVKELGADLLSLSAHKFYGPKGIGALYIRKGTKLGSYLLGGDQERGRRASTQNIPGAVGLAKAVALCQENMIEEMKTQQTYRDRLLAEIPQKISGVKINGHLHQRLPNNAHFSFQGVEGESLLMNLDMNGICASMGSACTSGAMEASRVLKAIGLEDDLAYGALRITLGRWSTEEHIERLLEVLPSAVEGLRL